MTGEPLQHDLNPSAISHKPGKTDERVDASRHPIMPTRHIGKIDVCSWPTESFLYDGLCTHSSFTERPTGGLLASPEELRAADAEMKKRRRDAPRRWRERAKMRDSAKYLKLKRDERALHLLRHPDAQRKADKRVRECALAEQRH